MIDKTALREMIKAGESLTLEYKGEKSKPLSDGDIYEVIVSMANADGGILLIGVEDDGTITGAKPRHGASTDPIKLQAAIFNNTEPRINTRVSLVDFLEGQVIVVEVDPYPEICAARSGSCVRRILGVKGPECVPFYPHEHLSRRIALGLVELSAQLCSSVSFEDLSPLEFERLRQTARRLNGDPLLFDMKDLEIAKALQLGETVRGEFIPNMAGLLFLGREKTLQKAIPTHEVAFQVLDRALNVKVNDFFRSPLLKVVEEIQGRFDARVEEEEIMMGMYRLPLPEYGRRAFREALLNALLHRDYSQMGTVYVQWYHDHILMTNPGGLPLGITLQNILVHEPKPRNPVLYNAAKRIGLVERTGRGVDKIYEGQIRSGHAPPSYGRSDMNAVRLVLVGGRADQAFARYIYELDRDVTRIEFDDLLLLHRLYSQGDASKVEIAALVQKTNEETLGILERLKGFDVIQLVAKKPGEVYVLKAAFSSRAGPDEWRDGILDFVRKNERITRLQAMALFGLSRGQASRLLRKMSTEGLLRQHGASPKGTYYTVGDEDGE